MPSLHSAGVRLIDVIHCLLGLISCDFSAKGIRPLIAPPDPNSSFTNNAPQIATVAPSPSSSSGTGALLSLTIAGCPSLTHCAIPPYGLRHLKLTYTTPVLIDPNNDDNTVAKKATAIYIHTLTEVNTGKSIALVRNGTDVCRWQDCPVLPGGKIVLEDDFLPESAWAGKEFMLRIGMAVPGQVIAWAEAGIGVADSPGSGCGKDDFGPGGGEDPISGPLVPAATGATHRGGKMQGAIEL